MGEVEKHILENQGNAVVDEFKNNVLEKFSTLIQQLTPITNNNKQPMAFNNAMKSLFTP